ncbi:biliverdin-producing heme oxygenase [Kribbella sp. NPDC051770]|uniref:biliverdin-producing heme oxygenase n=1 Tax=Kribbella sp. NPDC051770 TaxID=3155413 RepID=UPI0034488818
MTSPFGSTAQPFSQRLRERSLSLHRDAEGSTYLTALTTGRLDLGAYAALVAQHAVIYQALERVGAGLADDLIAGPFHFPQLNRCLALEADLAFLRAAGVPIPEPTEATRRYADRLDELATWPGGFIAHHYVRYLGDLSGGQAIGRLVASAYGLERDGVRFYTFEQIPAVKPFKDRYRALLDETGFDEREQEQVLEEVLLAYRFNVDVLTSIAELVLPRHPQVAS